MIYEAPHRVARDRRPRSPRCLGGERELVVARELTKKFETITRMPLAEAAAWFAADANRERGEFVLIVDLPSPAEGRPARRVARAGRRALARALIDELPPARAARLVAAVSGEPRDLVYARALALKK